MLADDGCEVRDGKNRRSVKEVSSTKKGFFKKSMTAKNRRRPKVRRKQSFKSMQASL